MAVTRALPAAGRRGPGGRSRRDLPLLLAGALVSSAGTALTLVAVVLHLRPAGAGWVALALAAEAVPAVLAAPVAGRLVDRLPNRRLLAGALLLQGAAVLLAGPAALAGVAGVGGPGGTAEVVPVRAWALVACLAVLGIGAAIANPAIAALLPHLCGEDGATRAFGRYAATGQAGFLAGASVAGVLVEVAGIRTVLLLDAATYLVMAAAVTGLRAERRPGPAGPAGPVRAWAGFGLVARDRVLRTAVGALTVTVVAAVAVNVADVFFAIEDVGASPASYGVITACWPLAGVAGGWLAGRLAGDRRLVAALALAGVAMGAGLAGVAAIVTLPCLVAAWIVGGAANAVQVTCINALTRSRCPEELRGRAFAAVGALFQSGNLAGLAGGSAAVALLGARGTVLAAGALTAVLGAGTWLLAAPAPDDGHGAGPAGPGA